MKINESPLPLEIEAAIPELLPEVREYLDLEEAGFNPRDELLCLLHGGEFRRFVVFDYAADDNDRPFAFIQYSLAAGLADSACIGCWPRTEGEALVWSIEEYFKMNPLRNE